MIKTIDVTELKLEQIKQIQTIVEALLYFNRPF